LLAEVTEVLGGESGNVGSDGLLDDACSYNTDGDSDGSGGCEEGRQGSGGKCDSAGAEAEEGERSDLAVGDGEGADKGGEECKDLGVHCESWKKEENFVNLGDVIYGRVLNSL